MTGRKEIRENEFENYHPAVLFCYFVVMFVFSMMLMHPLCIALSCLGAFSCEALVCRGAMRKIAGSLLIIPVSACFNPLFSHEGATVLLYFPNGSPLTLESVLYGAAAGGMLCSVIAWFSCFHAVMTGERLTCIFGRLIPALSLVFTVSLRFVPRTAEQLREIARAQKGIGKGLSDGTPRQKLQNALSVLSSLVTASLEGAIGTADSMKARGYGLPGRSAYSIFRFRARDAAASVLTAGCTALVIFGIAAGKADFRFFPTLRAASTGASGAVFLVSFGLLCFLPAAAELWEEWRWKAFESKR